MVGTRYTPKLLFVCDWCTTLPKKAISVAHPSGRTALADKAIKNGWWMRPKHEGRRKGTWTHCCPDCVERIIKSANKADLRAISSKQFAEYKLG